MRATQYNLWFKKIRISHAMTLSDVVRCCELGGLAITKSRADGWSRGEHDQRRFAAMSAEQFAAFCDGLIDWANEAYEDRP